MVLIDTVYQRVLAIANKEQRGYITPQEFNLFANQAQMNIFEQYFYDLNQFRRLPGNDSKYADMIDILEEKLNYFKQGPTTITNGVAVSELSTDSPNLFYRLGDINFNSKIVEEIRYEDYYRTQISPLTKATPNRPIYWRKDGKIYFEPDLGTYSVHWIRKPKKVNWTYVVVNNKTALYNGSDINLQNFELHDSEETSLVTNVLKIAGIAIKDQALAVAAVNEDSNRIKQEKQ